MSNSTQYITLTAANFEREVLHSELPVLVDFWADWCGPCRVMNPIIAQLAAEWVGKVKIAKLNIDNEPQLASQYQIQAIPTILLFDKGQIVSKISGVISHSDLTAYLADLVSASRDNLAKTV